MFYSQRLNQKNTDNVCARCEKKFQAWVDYHQHVVNGRCGKIIKPVKTTTRTTKEIVAAVEATFMGFIIS